VFCVFQIEVKADLPVGNNLMDHPVFFLPFSINRTVNLPLERLRSYFEFAKYLLVGKGNYNL
jgi:hypothetical protein